MNKIIKMLTVASVCAGFICAGITRFSYVDDVDQRQFANDPTIKVEENIDINGVYADDLVYKYQELLDNSEVIVKVHRDKDAKAEVNSGATITKVKVLDTIKGDVDDKYIYVLEPIYYFREGDYMLSMNHYKLMSDDSDYILFLNKYNSFNVCESPYLYIHTTTSTSKYNVNLADDVDKTRDDYWKYCKFREQLFETGK